MLIVFLNLLFSRMVNSINHFNSVTEWIKMRNFVQNYKKNE